MKRMMELQLHEQLTEEQRLHLQQEATHLMTGHSIIRTWNNGTIVEDDETRDDDEIIHYAKELQHKDGDYIKAPRLIGHVLGFSMYDINDS